MRVLIGNLDWKLKIYWYLLEEYQRGAMKLNVLYSEIIYEVWMNV